MMGNPTAIIFETSFHLPLKAAMKLDWNMDCASAVALLGVSREPFAMADASRSLRSPEESGQCSDIVTVQFCALKVNQGHP